MYELTLTKRVMKKTAIITGTLAAIVLLGAGCAPTPTPAPSNQEQTQTPTQNWPETAAPGELKDMPEITELKTPIKNDDWITTTTKNGITLKTPNKGATAPTAWTYTLLKNDDSHLNGDCYVTDTTVYKKTTGFGFENACQTTTEIKDGPGERTDYFVFHSGYVNGKNERIDQAHLFTFTKKYPANFDMNAYSATLLNIINIID